MKEIKYDGNLKDNIEKSKLLNFAVLKKVVPICVLCEIIGIILASFFGILSLQGIANSITILAGAIFIVHEVAVIIANSEIATASTKLKKDANIEISEKNLKNAKVLETVKSNTIRFNDNHNEENTIINYFATLDKENQIQILKQIKTIIDKKEDNELYLLEDRDSEKKYILKKYINK